MDTEALKLFIDVVRVGSFAEVARRSPTRPIMRFYIKK